MKIESHRSVGGIVRHRMDAAGHQRFSGPSKEGRGAAEHRRSLDPDEWLVRLRADADKKRTRMRMSLEQQERTTHLVRRHDLWAGLLLPVDMGTSDEWPRGQSEALKVRTLLCVILMF